METLTQFLSITIPAAAVLFAMYLTIKAFLNKEFQQKKIEIRLKNQELILPARLQAYERVCLLLERISPTNLIPRVNDSSYTVAELQAVLLGSVREEFHHNISQQVYMSDQSWNLVKNAIQEVTTLINKSAQNLNKEDKGIELARVVIDNARQAKNDPIGLALTFVKNEIRQLY